MSEFVLVEEISFSSRSVFVWNHLQMTVKTCLNFVGNSSVSFLTMSSIIIVKSLGISGTDQHANGISFVMLIGRLAISSFERVVSSSAVVFAYFCEYSCNWLSKLVLISLFCLIILDRFSFSFLIVSFSICSCL